MTGRVVFFTSLYELHLSVLLQDRLEAAFIFFRLFDVIIWLVEIVYAPTFCSNYLFIEQPT